jgi:Domain of unknown function (DUF4167)
MNNRQNGRRRGRNNNQRPQVQGRGNQDQGNRIDNRARGNATQLLEKYRNMARDAQLSGDRVMTEYYLQFADHYFRVLSDTRLRQEEQRARFDDRDGGRDDNRDDNREQAMDGGNEEDGDDIDELDAIDSIGRAPRNRVGREHSGNRDGQQRDSQQQQRDGNRDSNRERGNGDRNGNRDDSRREEPRRDARPEREGNRDNQPREARSRDDQPRDRAMRDGPARDAGDQPRRPRRERPERNDEPHDDAPVGIDVAVLPPAIGIEPMRDEGEPAEAAAPKRRGRPRKVTAEAADSEGAAA